MTKLTSKLLSKLGMQIEARGSELDLVCGMELPQETQYKVAHKGRVYYFCSEGCQKHFEMILKSMQEIKRDTLKQGIHRAIAMFV